jgi:membrane associated rhomboid family serine protease
LIALAAGAVWLVAVATQGGQTIPETALGQWMALRTDHFDLRALFSHHLLHANWLHLLVNVAAILYAGRVLEAHWGPLRFSIFYFAAALLGGLATYLVGLCSLYAASPQDPAPVSISFGASGAAFACLTAYTLVWDRPLGGWLTERYVVWTLMILGAAGLLFLQEGGAGAAVRPDAPVLLTPQIAGIAAGAMLYCLIPWWDRWRSNWRRSQRFLRGKRVLDIRTRVDEILEKISRDGMESLSREERSFLQDASKHFRTHG